MHTEDARDSVHFLAFTCNLMLLHVAELTATLLFFAPARALTEVLSDMVQTLGGHRQCTIARELTKAS